MIKAIRIGNNIVATLNGKMYSKEFPDVVQRAEVYEKLLNASDADVVSLISIFQSELTESEKQLEIEFERKKEESKKLTDILDFMKDVKENGHDIFEVFENSLYVKGIRISTPELLIRELMKANNELGVDGLYPGKNIERINALLNFWKLCALNPDPRARFDLFKFLINHNLTLTPSGNFVAYRTVDVYTSGDAELERFVTQEWLKVKRWKKAPSHYEIYKTSEGYISKGNSSEGTHVGNLDELYQNISTVAGNVYTDAHTGKMRIKMGEPVVMDRNLVDADTQNPCSKGLHLGNETFMKANMGYFGKVGMVCLVNPKDVTSVPEYDSGKMRTCKYLPIAIAELENGHIKSVDIDVFDLEMAQNTQEELDAMSRLNSTELEEYKKHEFIAPEVDFKMIRNIRESLVMSINDANDKIKNRVVKL
jgi:hypothetical protein